MIKTKEILLTIGGVFAIAFVNAQTPTLQWAKSFGGTQTDHGNSITVDGNGNVYSTGDFSGQVDFDPNSGVVNISSTGTVDAFITKMDNLGNLIWAKNFGGDMPCVAYSITTDLNGNVYAAGRFQGTVDFDPGASFNNMTSLAPTGFTSVFIVKLNNSGNFVWAKQFEGNYFSRGISTDDLGNVYTSGEFTGTVDFDPGAGVNNLTSVGSSGTRDIFISKLDESGNFLWAKSMGGAINDECFSIFVDASNNVYTTGIFMGTADFDPGIGVYNLTTVGSNDIFISKLDATGNFIWAKSIGSSAQDVGYSIAVDLSGNVYTTGTFEGTVDFDPEIGSTYLSSNGSADIFVLKLNSVGNFVWVKQFGSSGYDLGYSIALDSSGDIYTTGTFQGTVDFDPNAGVTNLATIGVDVFIVKLDGSGNLNWAKNYGSTAFVNSLSVDSEGSIYSIGDYNGTMDFDSSPNVYNLTSTGLTDVFIHKLDMVSPEEYCDFVYSINNMVVNFSSTNPNCASFIWDFGNGNTSTINPNPIVTYSTPGTYSPCFQCNTPANCLSCVTITVPSNGSGGTTGLENVQSISDIKIYPNPSNDFITIEKENNNFNSNYIILNSIGQQVLSGQVIDTKNLIDIRNLSVGFYLIKIGETDGPSFKLMKN